VALSDFATGPPCRGRRAAHHRVESRKSFRRSRSREPPVDGPFRAAWQRSRRPTLHRYPLAGRHAHRVRQEPPGDPSPAAAGRWRCALALSGVRPPTRRHRPRVHYSDCSVGSALTVSESADRSASDHARGYEGASRWRPGVSPLRCNDDAPARRLPADDRRYLAPHVD
jgi:hypothetical protein